LPDALAPAVRFMLLFVLFTAAGTSVLLLWRSGRPASNNPAGPTAATADPTIAVPTAMEQSVTVLERAVLKPEAATGAAPSAKGPKGAARHGAQSESTEQRISIGAADVEAAIPVSAESPPPGTVSPYPTTNFPLVMLAGTENGPLPRVRTTDDADQKSTTDDAAGIHASTDDGTEGDTARAPAVARLQGEVLAVPVR
jgi:hypothetical protein